MAKKANYQKAIEKLKEKGVTDDVINNALNGCADNKAKFEALKPLCNAQGISFDKKETISKEDNSPTLQQYFGKSVSDLLIEKKKLMKVIFEDKDNLKDKKYNEMSPSERINLKKLIENDGISERLKEIDEKLQKKGIIIKPEKKKENNTNSTPETNQN